jgi:hypothetical protein
MLVIAKLPTNIMFAVVAPPGVRITQTATAANM